MTSTNEAGRTASPATNGTVYGVYRLARRVCEAASILQVVAIIGAVAGVIGGIALANQTSANSDGSTGYPFGWIGFAVIAGAVIGGLMNWVVATAIRLWANNVALQHGFDAEAASTIAFRGNPGQSGAPTKQGPEPFGTQRRAADY